MQIEVWEDINKLIEYLITMFSFVYTKFLHFVLKYRLLFQYTAAYVLVLFSAPGPLRDDQAVGSYNVLKIDSTLTCDVLDLDRFRCWVCGSCSPALSGLPAREILFLWCSESEVQCSSPYQRFPGSSVQQYNLHVKNIPTQEQLIQLKDSLSSLLNWGNSLSSLLNWGNSLSSQLKWGNSLSSLINWENSLSSLLNWKNSLSNLINWFSAF